MARRRGPSPAKLFEIAVSEIFENIGAEIVSQGECYECGNTKGFCDCDVKYCPDIVGEYEGFKFVADCKLYGENTYLTKEICDKLVRDKNESGAVIGIMVLSGGRVSASTREKLQDDDIFLIEVGYKKPYWIDNLIGQFEDCF